MASTPLAARLAERRFGERSQETTASAAEPDWRYERKFVVADGSLPSLRLAIRLHRAGFTHPYPARDVNNIYLDTHDLRLFRTHVNGTRERFKLRIRWYGDGGGRIDRGVLEVKRKLGAVGTKEHYPVPPFSFGADFSLGKLRGALLESIRDPELVGWIGGVEPALFNRYRRLYYVSADRRHRLTLDSQLQFRAIGPWRSAAHRLHASESALILELKCAVADGPGGARIAQTLPARLGKYSKYLRGIERLYGLEA
jgi:hypothetical protein